MPQRRQLHDRFFKQAKADGYAARSAYKLKHIQEKFRLIRPGDRVLDLGCAPGSWMQVAAELAGPRGDVAGIDLQPTDAELPAHASSTIADIFKSTPEQLLALGRSPGRRFNVVLSDMAPSTTGDPGGDHFRSVELCRRVLTLLPSTLAPGGHSAMKVFEGEAYPTLLREVARVFELAKGFKPEATRQVSREMFIVAKGYRAPAVISIPPPARPSPAAPTPIASTSSPAQTEPQPKPAPKNAPAKPTKPAATTKPTAKPRGKAR